MSFILDALRRAQNAHEHTAVDSTPIFADRVPDSPANYRQRAAWFLGAVMTLGVVAALAWWFGRVSVSGEPPAPVTQSVQREAVATPAQRNMSRQPVRALDREVVRAAPAAAATTINSRSASPAAPTRPGSVTIMPAPSSSARPTPSDDAPASSLPQYENLLVEGAINLPNLKMDMHVYNRTPAKRFVFINFKKYREGDTLDRQTAIEEITPTGAVLNYDGQRFLLRTN
jgi:general secretion pathway protein B